MQYFPDTDNTVIDLKLTRDEFLLLIEITKPFVTGYNDGMIAGIQEYAKIMNGASIFDRETEFNLFEVTQAMLAKMDLLYKTLTCWHCGKPYEEHTEEGHNND